MQYSKASELYRKGGLVNPGQKLFTSKAKKQGQGEVTIDFYEGGLNQTSSQLKSLVYDFDVKFSFTLSPPEIHFEKGEVKVTYELNNEEIVHQWRSLLRKKINQRGFHEQFKPIKKIGKGNFASVYLAEKLEDKTNYAVKAFSKEAAYSEDKGKECLIKQIEVMRCLNHKNTMKLHEVFESENSLYIIFELLEGGQLYDKVKAKYKFKQHETQLIIRGILLGLRQMHEKNIMHRDLKPQNLLFRKEGDYDCVIADFGLAEFCNAEQYLFVRCGTPGYVAPEVINIKDMKTKYASICDIFSLGLIFHLLQLGKNAFPGTTYNQVLSQNRACNISFTQEDQKKAGPQAINLIEKMLKKNPNDRITAEEALKHPYFKLNNPNYEDMEETPAKVDNYPTIDSPLLTSSNQKRKLEKSIKKDSCLDFKMGKENMLTGKTETVGTVPSKLSGVDNVQLSKKVKVSQFSKENK